MNKTGLLYFAEVIYETLKKQGLDNNEIVSFFDGYKKNDIYRYFADKQNEKILKSVRLNHYNVEDIIYTMKIINDGKNLDIQNTYITYTQILFVFFFVIQKKMDLNKWSFMENLYCAADHNYDLFSFKNVNDIILYNTIRLNKGFEFWKSEIEYWEQHKREYVPNLQLPVFKGEDSAIVIAESKGCNKDCKKKTISPRTAVLYEQWRRRLITEDNLEDEQSTRMSIRLINHETMEWKGFVADSPEKTKKLIGLVLDSGNRRIYYFNKLVDQIIKAQERCEDREFIKDYLICVMEKNKRTCECHKCIKIDALLKILNCIFDGVSRGEKNALGNFNERVTEFYNMKLLEDKDIEKNIFEHQCQKQVAAYPCRRKRKYIYAYVVGEYQAESEKDKEVSISKELLLMMVLVLKTISPDTYSLADVEKMLFNSRYGGELGNTLFEYFFITTFDELHEKGEALSVRERFAYVQKQSAKYELFYLYQRKTPFADAIMNKETFDGK